jgi:hypothetical protein
MLVGQLDLQQSLQAPAMRQLDQRVSIRYQLQPLTRDEVAAYISHRVRIAGPSTTVSFESKAIDLVHRRTAGIPRLVNLLCDRTLLAAYSARTNRVAPEMVKQASRTLDPRRSPDLSLRLVQATHSDRCACTMSSVLDALRRGADHSGTAQPKISADRRRSSHTRLPTGRPGIAPQPDHANCRRSGRVRSWCVGGDGVAHPL